MGSQPIDRSTAVHYVWGDVCDGWRLVDSPGLSVIHERMPPGSREIRHLHNSARQFFFVLSGELTLEVGGDNHVLAPQQGLEIAPLTPHQAINTSTEPVEFLVISQPTTRGDRTPA